MVCACAACTPAWEAVSYRGLFIAGWFGVREKQCSRLEIYDRLRASEQAVTHLRALFLCYSLCSGDVWNLCFLRSGVRHPVDVVFSAQILVSMAVVFHFRRLGFLP